jgi:SAM-dependent methyltransferase
MKQQELTDSSKFSMVSRYAFAPVYPYLAGQIIDKFGLYSGTCIDVGSGPGNLAIEIARITEMKVYSLDIQPEMSRLARNNIRQAGLSERITAVTADVCQMPFPQDWADLVVSRGSIFFWENQTAGCCEIFRVLKPGGVAYCGGGMGTPEIRAQVLQIFVKTLFFRRNATIGYIIYRENPQAADPEGLCVSLDELGVQAMVERENDGIWIQMKK